MVATVAFLARWGVVLGIVQRQDFGLVVVVVGLLEHFFKVVVQRQRTGNVSITFTWLVDQAALGLDCLVQLLLCVHRLLEGLDELCEFGLLLPCLVLSAKRRKPLHDFDERIDLECSVDGRDVDEGGLAFFNLSLERWLNLREITGVLFKRNFFSQLLLSNFGFSVLAISLR